MSSEEAKNDAVPFVPEGKPLPIAELYNMAVVTPQDISAAIDKANSVYPKSYKGITDT